MSYWCQYPDLTFQEEGHRYLWKGVPRRSVSGVLSSVGTLNEKTGFFDPVGYGHFAKQYENAAEFGTAFHKIASAIVQGKNVKYPVEMESWVIQLRAYLKAYPLVPINDVNGVSIIEYPMYSVRHGYCGTPDLVACNAKREVCVIDWKTSAAHEKHYDYQTAAYAQLVEEVHKLRVKRRITLRVTDTKYDPLDRTGHSEDLIMFNSLNNVLKMAA